MASNLRLTSLNVKHLNVTDNIRINGQFFTGSGGVIGVSSLVTNTDENGNITNDSLASGMAFFYESSYQGGNKTLLSIFGDLAVTGGFLINGSYKPTTSKSKGKRGTITFDDNHIYVCIKEGEEGDAEWKRTALSSW